ncbi:TATE DNA Transposon [Leptomonas pyrrhocoris]|uniref:TATE DNA Transposon n=1 Tax=Leptomonas pyrrhocoris TaxID=157538 RepID=A0A0N0DRV3_LEPPY|nr:TATE DNA Transposon [Leptomonas pyrrhocoris]KPA75011.1 TATE DNA Transposon [Leptomonas pyrrhocoris]|eukprot:XP_015653450.1 TATE DNA Transposon [Leptomonas pyrrhocoris]
MTELDAQRLQKRLLSGEQPVTSDGYLFFPLFLRHHWMAGVLSIHDSERSVVMTIHDSAPSVLVHRDLYALFGKLWPELVIRKKHCPHQKRGSEDCGLYMAGIFFSYALGVRIARPNSLGKRMRYLLWSALQKCPDRTTFLRRMRQFLTRDQSVPQDWHKTALLEAGGRKDAAKKEQKPTTALPSKQKKEKVARAVARRKPSASEVVATPAGPAPRDPFLCEDEVLVPSSDTSVTDEDTFSPTTIEPGAVVVAPSTAIHGTRTNYGESDAPATTPAGVSHGSTYLVDTHAQQAVSFFEACYTPIAERNLCFFAAATSLMNVGDGGHRRMAWHTLAVQAKRFGFHVGIPYDLGDALSTFGVALHFTCHEDNQARVSRRLIEYPPTTSPARPSKKTTAMREQTALFVQTPSPAHGLSVTVRRAGAAGAETFSFRLGAKLAAEPAGARSGPPVTRWFLTTDPHEAIYGVYLPSEMVGYPAETAERQSTRRRGPKVGVDKPPAALLERHALRRWRRDDGEGSREVRSDPGRAAPPVPEVVETDEEAPQEVVNAVETPVTTTLNWHGDGHPGSPVGAAVTRRPEVGEPLPGSQQPPVRPPDNSRQQQRTAVEGPTLGRFPIVADTGRLSSPRTWYIHADKPPHISQLAWNQITPQMRFMHIRWLKELRSMPADLLRFPLPSAALELVRRMAHARHWKWATTAKALSAISGALRSLPLYTNFSFAVDLSKDPEFAAGLQAAHRYEREEEKEPPAPITHEQYRAAWKKLDEVSPIARLYLAMMWAFAARPSDVASMRRKDVILSPVPEDGGAQDVEEEQTSVAHPAASGGRRSTALVNITVTMRENKGARFRGPYPVASQLIGTDASTLQQLLHERRPRQRVFAHAERLCTRVRAALRFTNPEAALPSVRKGAARHMAACGVPEEQIARLTGHTRLDTLRRYLGYGLQLTAEAESARANAARALHHDQRP